MEAQTQIPSLKPEKNEERVEMLRRLELTEILSEDVWNTLHPVAKIVVKILQHVYSKLNDMAEVRVLFDDDQITVTTHKSRFTIGKDGIEFIRRYGNEVRVQRAKIKLSKEVIETVKEQIMRIVEYGSNPDYGLVISEIEKALNA
jgi:hypothetical protein